MASQKNVLEEHWINAKTTRERIFFMLANHMHNSALAIQKGDIQMSEDGKENSSLGGTILSLDSRLDDNYYDVSPDLNVFSGEEKINGEGVEQKIGQALSKDGGIIVEKKSIVASGVFYDNTKNAAKKRYRVRDFHQLEIMFLPVNTKYIGNRKKTALSLALISENKDARVYCLSNSRFTDAGTGKLTMLSNKGTIREFYIALDPEGKLVGYTTDYRFDMKNMKLLQEKQHSVSL